MSNNELKIELYPNNTPRYPFEESSPHYLGNKDIIAHSLNPQQKLSNINSNVPFLAGFYTAHTHHYPVRIKPDDIWLLIVQAFSNHVNANPEELRHYFVNFSEKKTLQVDTNLSDITEVDKRMLEEFSEKINIQIKNYIGEELIDILTPNFSTTTHDSSIISKISIMGAFKNYFNFEMHLCGCGIPYIILEGTAEDYNNIIEKAKYLAKYEFDWYIYRIIPHIQKMVEAKMGNVDVDYFKDMIQKKEVTEIKAGRSGMYPHEIQVNHICGWFLSFFAYWASKNNMRFTEDSIKIEDFKELASQMLDVPFKIVDEVHNKTYNMKYMVGFAGCSLNENKEVYPIQAWFVYHNKLINNNMNLKFLPF